MLNASRIRLLFLSACLAAGTAQGDLREDVGLRLLALERGSALPDGASIPVAQIEAATATGTYLPDAVNANLIQVQFSDRSGFGGGTSSHATGIALYLASPAHSLSPGVSIIDNYLAVDASCLTPGDWVQQVLLGGACTSTARPQPGTTRLANHSWAGAPAPADTAILLERLDWLIDAEDSVHVVGVSGANPLLSHAYNVVPVRNSATSSGGGTTAVDGFYVAGRANPLIVAPANYSSTATAVVTSAVAVLLDAAPGNHLPPEIVKAALLAGANRETDNTLGDDLITYVATTANGLDSRYGAGQLNLYTSEQIIAAGQQPANGGISAYGYDYSPAFGGANGTAALHTYRFDTGTGTTRIAATLAWNASIEDGIGAFDPNPLLHPLELALYDVSGPTSLEVARSASRIDNTQTLWLTLAPSRSYELRVSPAAGVSFEWDYAIAWNLRDHANLDVDLDGLANRHETNTGVFAGPDAAGTNPFLADTDDDGLEDGAEVNVHLTNPLNADSDGDGVGDGIEIAVGTDPRTADARRVAQVPIPFWAHFALGVAIAGVTLLSRRRVSPSRLRRP